MNRADRLFFLALFLLVATFIGFVFRYDLGLKKPTFKPGDCISYDLSNEFQKSSMNYEILKVGKTYYLARWYNEKSGRSFDKAETKRIESTDSEFQKVECPKEITILDKE